MDSAQQLLGSQRDVLLKWTVDHPAPLLRWLRDGEVLSSADYLSLPERTPSNAVAMALQMACAAEESCPKVSASLGGETLQGHQQATRTRES